MTKKDELRHWDEQIRDLECRIEQEKRRLSAGESHAWGSVEVLRLMEQTLEIGARTNALCSRAQLCHSCSTRRERFPANLRWQSAEASSLPPNPSLCNADRHPSATMTGR